ncbi:hypothetical protein JCM11491_005283 [Sporobolomyces phaffii]
MYTAQELTDRLVVATEEQDCLYVLYWLQEMTQLDSRDQAINAEHSWKHCSALTTVVGSSWSTLNKTNLELLLLCGAEPTKRIVDHAMERENWGALQIILDWTKGGNEEAKAAAHLLSLDIEDAADWIDRNLPPPPNARNLTGCGELPSAPFTTTYESGEPLDQVSGGIATRDSVSSIRQPVSRPADSTFHASDVFFYESTSDTFDILLRYDCYGIEAVGRIPFGFRGIDIEDMFATIGVRCRVLRCASSHLPTYAVVEVPAEQAILCIKFVNGQRGGSDGSSRMRGGYCYNTAKPSSTPSPSLTCSSSISTIAISLALTSLTFTSLTFTSLTFTSLEILDYA